MKDNKILHISLPDMYSNKYSALFLGLMGVFLLCFRLIKVHSKVVRFV